jgi:hypothetical protein
MRNLPSILVGSWFTAVLLTPLQSSALAQPAVGGTGSVTARSYQPIVSGTAISVVSAENTDQYERLKASIEESLRARGYKVSEDGLLVLEFYGSEVLGNRVVEKPTEALALRSAVPGADRTEATGLLDSLNNSLFGEKSANSSNMPDTQPAVRQVHLSMTLTDRRVAKRIWQGTAAGDLRYGDSFGTTQSLVPFLVGKIGMSANGERFDMP